MKEFLYKSVFFFFTLLCNLGADCQPNDISFTNYSTKDGLSSATVYDIIKDKFGFIWLATEDGLSRFDGTNFKGYRHDPGNLDGLKVNHITSLHESLDGTIWIGTNGGGLCYLDRKKDSIYNYKATDPTQIGPAITAIRGDKEGNVWITSFGGLYIINPVRKELVTGKFGLLRKAVAGKVVTYFLQDKRDRLWIGTDNGIYLYEPLKNTVAILQHHENYDSTLPGNAINKIVEDRNGNIWVATNNGLAKLLPDGRSFSTHSATTGSPRLSSSPVTTMGVDSRNRLWIGTNEGLDIFDLSTNKISSCLPDKRNTASISSRSILSILIDKGIYWVGTFRGGVNKYDENFNYFNLKEYNVFDPFGLRTSIVTSFAAYQYGVFVGTDGGGLQLYDRNTGLLTHVNLPSKEKSDKHDLTVLTLEMAKDEQLWIGTFSNGLFRYNPASGAFVNYAAGPLVSQLNNNDVFCLKEDSKGNIWVGTNGGGINLISPPGGPIVKYVADPSRPNDPARPNSNFIRSFEEDSAGHIWIGSFGSGIAVFDPGSKQFWFYTKQNSGLPSDYVMAIKQDRKGNMWVGTSGNGIGLLKRGGTRFESLTEKDGLANGSIHKIIEDAIGNIWVSTNKGLSCYDPVAKKFKNYTSHNGLQSGAFVPRAGTKAPDGELYFGGQNGFNHFNPADFKTNRNIPPVVFTSLEIDNQTVQPSGDGPINQSILLAESININYKQAFSIGFEALDFTVPGANQYEYQLKGFDKTWVSAGKEHSAYYANIPPGEYVFQVRASNNDGIWNKEGRSIRLVVSPPFWRTIYAFAAYLLLVAGILFYIRHLGIKKIQTRFALEQERQRTSQLIERERKEAEYMHKLDQAKIKFLTNLSHEFRTPISLIMGPVDNLIGNIKEEALLNQLNLIKRNSRRLLNLVNQLLDFRKMEEKELKLQYSEGNIVSFMKDVCDSFNDLAKRKKIEFSFYAGVKGITVLFDHDKVERILFNILSNAFKFTPENGNIAVVLSGSDLEPIPGSTSITVSIHDSGIGIPVEYQPYIFESFFQHETSTQTLNHGTGIGLSITREFVQLHGGKVSVESEPGKGSTFKFNLILKNTEENREVIQSLAESEPLETIKKLPASSHPAQPSILIVEDDDDFRYYIKENLMASYQIFEAPNGKEGWQRSLFHHPDIIICDVQMPVMNGLELVQKLKSDKRTRHIPLILLTAADTPHGALDGLESGAIDYMTKPFDFAVLQAKLHNILVLNDFFKENYSRKVTVALPETETVSAKEKFLQKALSYIYENIANPQLSVELLSTHLCISRASLYNRLLEYTGVSPVDFIRSVKLEKAKDLLQKSDLNIAAIAYETGFANPNYFTKVFKAQYKVTPSEFVTENRKS
ncbi:MAG: response regulator [Ferruginibacter sp.]|nr:response regulator [Ferruginibacter sp.]